MVLCFQMSCQISIAKTGRKRGIKKNTIAKILIAVKTELAQLINDA